VEDVAEFGSAAVEDADDSFAASKYLAFVDASDGTDGVDDVVVGDAVEDVGGYWDDNSDSTSDDADLLSICLACVALHASNLARSDAVFALSNMGLHLAFWLLDICGQS